MFIPFCLLSLPPSQAGNVLFIKLLFLLLIYTHCQNLDFLRTFAVYTLHCYIRKLWSSSNGGAVAVVEPAAFPPSPELGPGLI